MAKILLPAALLVLTAGTAAAQSALPNPARTPGAVNPAVTQANIKETICVSSWAKSVQPSERYTRELKRSQIQKWGYTDQKLGHYEEDHLIPIELGGSPTDPRNLWPEPHDPLGGWGSARKDILEKRLNHLVCTGRLSLDEARQAIARNWIDAYRHYVRASIP
ncbi:MAG TPA: hypothetical protein VJ770_17430 [Stellaceae bacterium]|nr:hypothetical protein [Stellaceae bacterium]